MTAGQGNTIPQMEPKTTDQILTLAVNLTEGMPRQALLDYLAKQPSLPSDFTRQLQITQQAIHYIPCWHIQGEYTADWQAEFGFYPYISCCGQPANGQFMWASRSGTDNNTYALNIPAVAVPDPVSTILADMPMPATAEAATPPQADCWQGITEPFADINTALENGGNTQLADYITTQIKRFAEGDNQKDWQWHIQTITCHATPIWLPVIQITFTYQDTSYTYWANAADTAKAHCDQLPTAAPSATQKLFKGIFGIFSK